MVAKSIVFLLKIRVVVKGRQLVYSDYDRVEVDKSGELVAYLR